jgi:hypothetical protein
VLFVACQTGHFEVVRVLLEGGADIEGVDHVSYIAMRKDLLSLHDQTNNLTAIFGTIK